MSGLGLPSSAKDAAALIVQSAELASCPMTRKMLRGIEKHAEHTPNGAEGTPSLLPGAVVNFALPI